MFEASSTVLVGLEIGTSKVCAMVGEVAACGQLTVLGIGQATSHGVRKGEIIDATKAAEDVRQAIAEAEEMANVEIRSVYLGVTGSHLAGFNNRGSLPIVSADRDIVDEDVQDVLTNAKAINLPPDHEVLHVVRQHFIVDGKGEIENPLGMPGRRLEVDVHVVHGLRSRLRVPVHALDGLQLEVEDVVFSGIASSLALLTATDKELGALVIDCGAGATEYVVYKDGIIKHTGVVAVGGDHVTNDLAHGLKLPIGRAEKLKLEHGAALFDDGARGTAIPLGDDPRLPQRTVNLEHLRRIMTLRLEELFELIAEDLEHSGALDDLRAGVFLCGGGARVPHLDRLAARVFGLPVQLGRANAMTSLNSNLDQPEFAAGLGLVKFGSFQLDRRKGRNSFATSLRRTLGQLLGGH